MPLLTVSVCWNVKPLRNHVTLPWLTVCRRIVAEPLKVTLYVFGRANRAMPPGPGGPSGDQFVGVLNVPPEVLIQSNVWALAIPAVDASVSPTAMIIRCPRCMFISLDA